DGPLVDVVVDGQIHPTQAAGGDASLYLVLPGDLVARPELGQERIRAAAVRTPPFALCLAVRGRAPDRAPTVPTEPLRLGDNRIRHQRGERILLGHTGNLDQPAAQPADVRQPARHAGGVVFRVAGGGVGGRGDRVLVILGAEDRLRGHRTQ